MPAENTQNRGVYYLTSVYAGDITNRIISKSGGIRRPLGKEQENVTLSRFYHPDIGCSDHFSLQFSDDAAISAGAGYPPAEPRAAHWAADGMRVAVSGLPQDVRHALALCREPGVSDAARGHGAGLRALFGGEPPARHQPHLDQLSPDGDGAGAAGDAGVPVRLPQLPAAGDRCRRRAAGLCGYHRRGIGGRGSRLGDG